MTLTEFLLARIEEDEADAYQARGLLGIDTEWHHVEELRRRGLTIADARHVARWSSARVLAECEAKRRIVEQMSDEIEYIVGSDDVLRALAATYADHPDYDERWRP